jgi:nicotinamidase-related amidase
MEPYVRADSIEEKTRGWLKTIEPFNQHPLKLNKERAALLIVDMQKFFLDPASPTFTCGGLGIMPNVKKLIESFRQNHRPVIYTCHVHHPDSIDAGIMGLLQNDEIATLRRIRCSETNCKSLRDSNWGCSIG